MGHGNISDLVALTLIGSSVVHIYFTELLFQDWGPIKAQFSTSTPELEAMLKFCGSLLLVVGMAISGVKWNGANGKMSGFGIFLCVFNMLKVAWSIDGGFVPRPYLIIAAALLLGGLHIFLFPSNAIPPKTEKTKNNHGNYSDLFALVLLAAAVQSVWFPNLLMQDLGPIKANFSNSTPELEALIKVSGGFLVIIAMMLSGVKWNPGNGKMSGMGAFLCAYNAGKIAYTMDAGAFVPRPFYLYAAVFFFTGLHIFLFPSNPLPPKADAKKIQ